MNYTIGPHIIIHFDIDPQRYHAILDSIVVSNSDSIANLTQEFKYYLSLSTQHERASITNNTIQSISTYLLKPNTTPSINTLYSMLFPNSISTYRQSTDPYGGFVGVCHKNNKYEQSYYNIGIDAKHIDSNILQSLVDHYYQQQSDPSHCKIHVDILGFCLYLLYERLHPHRDGNGRMGRLLFVENTSCNEYFPLSVMITKLKQDRLMQDIFDAVSFPYKHLKKNGEFTPIYEHKPEEYYVLHISEQTLINIVKCLCICKEYKQLHNTMYDIPKHVFIISRLINRIINDTDLEQLDENVYDRYCESNFDIEIHNYVMKTLCC